MTSKTEKQPPFSLKTIGQLIEEVAYNEMDPKTKLIFPMEPESISKIQKIRRKIKEKQLSIGEKLIKPAIALSAIIFINRVENKILKPIKPEYAEGFDNSFTELARDPSVLFIIVSNHTGHADAAGTAVISKHLTELANKTRSPENPFKGFMLTIAASLEAGHQNQFLQQYTRQTKIRLPKYALSLGEYTRKKDVDKYKMDLGSNREYAEKTSNIIRGTEERVADGLFYYVEGTVEGGRRMEEGGNKGQRKGTQKVNWEQYDKIINNAQQRHDRKVVIITVSSDGASEILDPDQNNRPTLKAIATVASPIRPRKSLLTLKVDLPILYDQFLHDLEQKIGHPITTLDMGDAIGRRISKPLSPEKQGYYKDSNN